MNVRFATAVCVVLAVGGALRAKADDRTWKDASGKYEITGSLVRKTNGQAHIRCSDGRLIAIEIAQLSRTDRDFIEKGDSSPSDASRPRGEGARKPERSGDGASPPRPAAAATAESKEVEATGEGTSRQEALKDAFRAAISQVVGEVVDSEVQVENDQVIKDEILTYSDGYIPHHDVISDTVVRGVHTIIIRATVERRRLVTKLRAASITVKDLEDDGEDIVGKIWTDREARGAAKAMVEKAFVGFPSDLLEARVVDWNPADDEGDHITLAVRVTIEPSDPAYQAFQKRLCQRLKDVAKLDGEFTTIMEKHENLSLSDPCRLQPIGKPTYFREDMKRLMPDVEQAFAAGGSRPPLVIAVATLPSKDRTRIDWRYFVLDGLAGDTVLAAARRRGSCKLTFLNANGEPVCVDRFDPCRDLFPSVPSTGRNPETIPWNKYLSKVWYVDSRNTGASSFDSLEAYESDSRWEQSYKPAIAFVAPLFFGSRYADNLLYVPELKLTRHVRLTEDEVRPIKQVRCELTFRESLGQ